MIILCVYCNQVLSIIDSSYHVLNDLKSLHVPQLKDKGKETQKYESFLNYKERISIEIPFLGVSLMNSRPEVSCHGKHYSSIWLFFIVHLMSFVILS